MYKYSKISHYTKLFKQKKKKILPFLAFKKKDKLCNKWWINGKFKKEKIKKSRKKIKYNIRDT